MSLSLSLFLSFLSFHVPCMQEPHNPFPSILNLFPLQFSSKKPLNPKKKGENIITFFVHRESSTTQEHLQPLTTVTTHSHPYTSHHHMSKKTARNILNQPHCRSRGELHQFLYLHLPAPSQLNESTNLQQASIDTPTTSFRHWRSHPALKP